MKKRDDFHLCYHQDPNKLLITIKFATTIAIVVDTLDLKVEVSVTQKVKVVVVN